jgi:hypothetical protein
MARNVANVDILTDTFNTWVLRTNEIIQVMNSEVVTANSTQGVTGTTASPRNALLNGTFTANTLAGNTLSLGANFVANSSAILVGDSLKLIANNSTGSAGQLLTTDGSRIYWSTAVGSGTVTQIANGAGVFFTNLPSGPFGSPITSYGTIGIRAGDGITVDSRGVSVNTQFIQSGITNASTLQGRVWEAPGALGSTTANSGVFTVVTSGLTTGYRLQGDTVFLISNSVFRTQGFIDATTPSTGGTIGAVRVRSNAAGAAYIQITNDLGTAEWANFSFINTGKATYSGAFEVQNFTFNGTAVHGSGQFPGTEVGYKIIPQIDAGDDPFTLNPTTSSGAHYYKTALNAFSITVPNNTTNPCPIGTAITFINDASTGDITLLQGSGVILQLGGTLTQGTRTIGPGGLATALKVQTNKWIVSGSEVS